MLTRMLRLILRFISILAKSTSILSKFIANTTACFKEQELPSDASSLEISSRLTDPTVSGFASNFRSRTCAPFARRSSARRRLQGDGRTDRFRGTPEHVRFLSRMPLHRYTHAILCRIPLSLRTRGEVTLDEARTQHLALAQLLRELDIDVVEMPPDENSPLCVFVEDVAVVCNGIALIARPNEPSRLKEVRFMWRRVPNTKIISSTIICSIYFCYKVTIKILIILADR